MVSEVLEQQMENGSPVKKEPRLVNTQPPSSALPNLLLARNGLPWPKGSSQAPLTVRVWVRSLL
jgi:hypothetical protein